MPEFIWISVFLLVLALIAAWFLQRLVRVPAAAMPESLRTVLVPAAEQELICQLEKILGSRYRVLWRVSLEDLLLGHDCRDRRHHSQHSLLPARRFTCVICRRDNFAILALVDYRPAGQAAGAVPPELLSSLPLLTLSEESLYRGDLKKLLITHFPQLINDIGASAVPTEKQAFSPAPHF